MKSFITLIVLLLVATAAAHLTPIYLAEKQHRQSAIDQTGGDPDQGKDAIAQYGCSSCHTIPGIRGPGAQVGPPLTQIGNRTYIGGVLKNNPDNMKTWLKNPPAVDPKTAMPNLHLSDDDIKNIACYLYTLR
jgi:cytochrome c